MRVGTAVAGIAGLFASACSVVGIRREETPGYEVLKKEGPFELRAYGRYVVARTQVEGPYQAAQREGFRRLAGYIFGDNRSKDKIAMTAPVTATPKVQSQRLEMTAPVEVQPARDGWDVTFMMPSEFSLDDLPVPNDPRIQLEAVKPRLVAAVRYSGGRSQSLNEAKLAELRAWVDGLERYASYDAPTYAGYDPPWTLPSLRRNEMHLNLRSVD